MAAREVASWAEPPGPDRFERPLFDPIVEALVAERLASQPEWARRVGPAVLPSANASGRRIWEAVLARVG